MRAFLHVCLGCTSRAGTGDQFVPLAFGSSLRRWTGSRAQAPTRQALGNTPRMATWHARVSTSRTLSPRTERLSHPALCTLRFGALTCNRVRAANNISRSKPKEVAPQLGSQLRPRLWGGTRAHPSAEEDTAERSCTAAACARTWKACPEPPFCVPACPGRWERVVGRLPANRHVRHGFRAHSPRGHTQRERHNPRAELKRANTEALTNGATPRCWRPAGAPLSSRPRRGCSRAPAAIPGGVGPARAVWERPGVQARAQRLPRLLPGAVACRAGGRCSQREARTAVLARSVASARPRTYASTNEDAGRTDARCGQPARVARPGRSPWASPPPRAGRPRGTRT